MAKKHLIFDTISEAQGFADLASAHMGYPVAGGTQRYTQVEPHLTDDRGAVLTCPKCHELMTQDQIDSLKTRAEMTTLGFFPEPFELI